MKVAVGLFGQLRTWEYIHEWTKRQYSGHDVDFFCSMKMFNTKTVAQADFKEVSWDEVSRVSDAYNPKRCNFIWPNLQYSSGSVTVFRALMDAYHLIKTHELETGEQYDFIVLQRFDAVFGRKQPDGTITPDGTFDMIYDNGNHRLTDIIVTRNANYRTGKECFRNGIDDWIISGSAVAMNTLGTMLVNKCLRLSNSEQLHDRYILMAHSGLMDTIEANGLTYAIRPELEHSMVRDEAAELLLKIDRDPEQKIMDIGSNWDKIVRYWYKS